MSSPRTYRLGIDLGTTYTAAVVCRRQGDAPWSEPEIVALGSQSASVASVLYLGADGAVLVGEAAERRALTEPDSVVRQFKRRIGDDVPLVVGNAVHTAHELAALMARWVVDKVAEREGGPADAIAVTHPAAWGDHKKELLAGALREVGLDGVTFLPEPQAAAVAYSARERVDAGGAVAVYDLGGGTFDAAVVRRTADGFELPGRAEGIEQLGGVDFDDRVFDHVRAGIGAALDELDFEDADVVSAVMRLRRECVEAKEALSFDTQATIPVMLPGIRTNVRLTRVEFEASIRSSIDHTVDALGRAVESASLTAADLQAVLLVGGSSRIPLVAQMISAELGRPVAVDSDPKTSIAMGAALTIAPRPVPRASAPPTQAPAPIPARAPDPTPVPVAASAGSAPADAGASGVLDLRALQQAQSAPVRPGPQAPGAYLASPAPPRPGYGEPAPPRYAGHAPAEPTSGGYAAPTAPPRPPLGSPPAPARPEVSSQPLAAVQDTGDGGWVEVPRAGSRSHVKTIVIVVVVALLIFGAALAAGTWIKAERQRARTNPTAPTSNARSFVPAPDRPLLVAAGAPGPVAPRPR